MDNGDFTPLEIFSAYKKLKNYFYYDNTSLFIRKRLADFEENVEKSVSETKPYTEAFWEKMAQIADSINKRGIVYWRAFFEDSIGFRITPKSFEKDRVPILTNRSQEKNLKLTRINIFIDAEIEVHIISVLWLTYVGTHLTRWIDPDNYAYQLELAEDEEPLKNVADEERKVVRGLRLYKPYFMQYQKWRDNAIKKAEQLLQEKKDIVILSLDIKDYFNSVRLNLREIQKELFQEKRFLQGDPKIAKLFTLLHAINLTYTNKIGRIRKLPTLGHNETILPIGLLSSGLLGNLYLRKFDKEVKEKLNPSYYGRYVDDLLFVLTNTPVEQKALSPVNHFLARFFVDRDILSFDIGKATPISFLKKEKIKTAGKGIIRYKYQEPQIDLLTEEEYILQTLEAQKLKFNIRLEPTLQIQSSKVILQDLDFKESPAIINNFKKNLEKNRSEFQYLPDEDEVDKEFDEDAFSLHYNDSLNKLRSIKELSEDKYGASKYLAEKLFATSMSDEKADKKTTVQILTFFKGIIGLSFHTLWEKVATYFVINEQPEALIRFYKQCKLTITNIEVDKYEDQDFRHEVGTQIKEDLKFYLLIAIATPIAFNPALKLRGDFDRTVFRQIFKVAKSIRFANLFRHFWLALPSINYTKYLFIHNGNNNLIKISNEEVGDSCDLGTNKLGKEEDQRTLEIDERLKLLSPRYVHFHELNLLQIHKTVHSIKSTDKEEILKFDNIPSEAFENYWRINHEWKYHDSIESNLDPIIAESRKEYFEITPSTGKDSGIGDELGKGVLVEVKNSSDYVEAKKKIALANIKVNEKNIRRSYLGIPNMNRSRRQELFKLINLVTEEKCDLFVLPEVSVPHQWIGLLVHQACRRNLGIIAGLEHWVNKRKFAFNFMVTILPIKKQNFTTCLIKVRLKNHYSHEEVKQLKGFRLAIPGENVSVIFKHYDLFKWKKTYFSVYNCFELADIKDRALFKSKVDFIIASEYNKDTSYFSEIAGSWVRDIHCFFIQVNSSDFGDSRVIQPSSTVTKNILQIKGGDNSTIIVGEIPIKELRNFQFKEYSLQKEDKSFKPTPPDFIRDNVLIRIKNQNFKEYGV